MFLHKILNYVRDSLKRVKKTGRYIEFASIIFHHLRMQNENKTILLITFFYKLFFPPYYSLTRRTFVLFS